VPVDGEIQVSDGSERLRFEDRSHRDRAKLAKRGRGWRSPRLNMRNATPLGFGKWKRIAEHVTGRTTLHDRTSEPASGQR
jgi:hypothetical protein